MLLVGALFDARHCRRTDRAGLLLDTRCSSGRLHSPGRGLSSSLAGYLRLDFWHRPSLRPCPVHFLHTLFDAPFAL